VADLLIVDDDLETAALLGVLLRAKGHEVRTAQNGAEGLLEIGSRVPDAVLLDVEMPRLSGPEMAFELFLHDVGLEKIPLVLLSGSLDLPGTAARVGTPYFLAKPFRVDAVLGILDRALVERRQPIPALDQR
jgi:DNA-binding NtrC family response regulator